jgi:hypothetical protein
VDVGSSAGARDILFQETIFSGENLNLSHNLFTGRTAYLTLTTNYSDGTSGVSTAQYTLQSMSDAVVGTYLGSTAKITETVYCAGASPNSVKPSVANIPQSYFKITRSGGTYYLSMGNVAGAVAPTDLYILPVSQLTLDTIVFSTPNGQLTASDYFGWSSKPILYPSITIRRRDGGSSGDLSLVESSFTFQAIINASAQYCQTVFLDVINAGLGYYKLLP